MEKQKSVGKKGGVLKGQRGRLLTWTSIPLSFLPTAVFSFAYLPLCIPKGVKYQMLSSRGCLDLVTHWPVWFADASKRKSTIIVPFIGLALVWKGSEKSNKHYSLRTERKSEIINLKFSFSPPATAIATAITRDYNENCWKCKYQLFKSVLNALVWFFRGKEHNASSLFKSNLPTEDWRNCLPFMTFVLFMTYFNFSRSRMFRARYEKSVTSERNRRTSKDCEKKIKNENWTKSEMRSCHDPETFFFVKARALKS